MDNQKTKGLHRAVAKTAVFTGALATLFSCAAQDTTASKTEGTATGTVLTLTHLKKGFEQTLYYQNNDQANAYKDTHANSAKNTALTKTPMPAASYNDTHGNQTLKVASSKKGHSYEDTHAIDLQINEYKGISLTNRLGKTQFIEGSFALAHAEVITLENKQWVSLVVFNNNTQHIEVYRLSVDTLNKEQRLSQPTKGSEALCAATSASGTPHIVNVDATGTLNHYELLSDQFLPLRSFAIGPGIKSCSVDLVTQNIYLADEFAGVWKIHAHIESELEKTLIFHHADTPVEGVSTVSNNISHVNGSLVGWVSPDQSGVWLQNQCHAEFITLMQYRDGIAETIEPEFIRLAISIHKKEPLISLIVDDDASGNFFVAELPSKLSDAYFNDGCLSNENETGTSNNGEFSKYSTVNVFPSTETQPVQNYGDAADDPAIWVNAKTSSQSRIVGTDKKGALNTYDLLGKQHQSLAVGRVNNVDVGYKVAVNSMNSSGDIRFTDIAVASNRSHNSLSVFDIDKNGNLAHLGEIKTTLSDIYGMCLYVDDGIAHVFANDTSGRFERYKLLIKENKVVEGNLSQSFSLPSQPEGCVVDTHTNTAYLGEEATGIWALDISSTDNTPTFISAITPPVEADVEGLALFIVDDKKYLIASSQGNNSYAIYHIHEENPETLTLMGLIKIAADKAKQIDGVSETDGLEATNANLGGAFTEGLWVVQDGRNVLPSQKQNFKLVAGTTLKNAIRDLVNRQD
ncbi:phytase [Alteromonas gracilis]|uniref:phytase n=1 Tax=Alteromonas gracilis TaxID=1479524 RepID=UPI002FE17BCE